MIIIKKYKYTFILLLIIFSSSLAIASSSSVTVGLPTVKVWHSGLEWVTGTSKSNTTDVACDSSEATSNASQTMSTYTHHYVKDFRTNSIGTYTGWNYTSEATTSPPQYGLSCRKLQTNLKFYSGALP